MSTLAISHASSLMVMLVAFGLASAHRSSGFAGDVCPGDQNEGQTSLQEVRDEEVVSLMQLNHAQVMARKQPSILDDEFPAQVADEYPMFAYSLGVSWKKWYDDMLRRFPPSDEGYNTINYGLVTDPMHHCAVSVPAGYVGHPWPFNNTSGVNMYATLASKSPVSLAHAQVLEVSSGRGGGAALLSDCFCPSQMVGMDFSSMEVVRAQSRYGRNGSCPIKFVEGDALDMPFANESFDVVINIEASHGYPSYRSFIREAWRVLRPGGVFLTADFRLVVGAEMDSLIMENVFRKSVLPIDVTHLVIRAFQENKLSRPWVAACEASYKKSPEQDFDKHCGHFAGVDLIGLPSLQAGLWNYRMYVLEK